jgi:N-acetylmuramoyl-L-alanine amidase
MLYVTRPALIGDDVRDLQRRLNRLGFDAATTTASSAPRPSTPSASSSSTSGSRSTASPAPSTVDLAPPAAPPHQLAPAYAVREREQLRRPARRTSLAGTRIMIDAGHSPELPGITAPDGTPEHEVTWAARRARRGPPLRARRPRRPRAWPATSPTPSERAALANTEDVEAIVSLHANGVDSTEARGAAAYYFGTEGYVSEHGAGCSPSSPSTRSAPPPAPQLPHAPLHHLAAARVAAPGVSSSRGS